MKKAILLTLLLSAPVFVSAMEEDLEKMEKGVAEKKALADLMQACGAQTEDELANQVRGKMNGLEAHGYVTILAGLKYLEQNDPDEFAKVEALVAPKRTGGEEQPADENTLLKGTLSILNAALTAMNSGGIASGNTQEEATNLNDTVHQVIEDQFIKTGCCGLIRTKNK